MDDLNAWIAFAQLRGLNVSRKHRLLDKFKNPKNIFSQSPHSLGLNEKFNKSRLADHIDRQKLAETLTWMEKSDAHALCHIGQKQYPKRLKQIPSAPLLLYLVGDTKLLCNDQIAMVGSRKSTIAGQQTAQQLATALAMSGLTITSGLALGIDAAAHQGALDCLGRTIAVLGSGVDVCYPRSNQPLYQKIAEQGLLISEFEPGSAPQRAHFPRRNRIISGLSLGVLVIEATERSGSLITANYALQHDREVFAVPGSIHANSSAGCLALIQQGAKLVRSANDVLEEFSEFSAPNFDNKRIDESKSAKKSSPDQGIICQISDSPVSFDKLISQSGLTIDQLCSMLLDLELQGRIEKLPGNQYIRTAN